MHVQSHTLLLADVFENFTNKCIEINELNRDHVLSGPGLAWQTCFKKTGGELGSLTNTDMLLMTEKEIRGGICHAIHTYVLKQIISIWKIIIKTLNHHTSCI